MSKKQPLTNASEIIERFGGIRPMAAKIDTPVTTVQGWKKRDVIPATRRDQILDAAVEHNVDISDIVKGTKVSNENNIEKKVMPPAKASEPVQVKPQEPTEEEKAPEIETVAATPRVERKIKSQSDDDIFATLEENNKKVLAKTIWVTVALILLAALVVLVLLRPTMDQKAKEQQRLLQQQQEELMTLKDQVNQRSSFMGTVIPEGAQQELEERMNDLQNQARNIQNTVDQLADRAGEISSEISSTVLGDAGGPLTMRLEALEEKMMELSSAGGLGDVVARINILEGSILGQEQLKASVMELQTIVDDMNGYSGEDALNENLAEVQSSDDEGSALSQTLQGVSGTDLKAAAMLITFSQLRDSLNREAPFDDDLKLLEKLVSDDNVELKGAIDRLAPHADGGVLTAKGLSGEFKGLAGDILEASIKGEDISFKEKAKARLNSLMKIEKEGELLNGTETQMTVSKAQKLLDEGDIQAAIAELQTLEGGAAETAQPFIQKAEVSLLAERVQQMLGENILSRITNQIPDVNMSSRSFTDVVPNMGDIEDLDMNEVKKTLQDTLPDLSQPEVIRDDESGVTILPSQPGFKGFSSGTTHDYSAGSSSQ